MLKVHIVDESALNEGRNIGEWVELPTSDQVLFGLIIKYPNYVINNYETDITGLNIKSYDGLSDVNNFAKRYEELADIDQEKVRFLLGKNSRFAEAISSYDQVAKIDGMLVIFD